MALPRTARSESTPGCRHLLECTAVLSIEAGRRNLLAVAEQAGIDLYVYVPLPGSCFKDDMHFSPAGHAYFADYLYRLLLGEIAPTFTPGDEHHSRPSGIARFETPVTAGQL